MLIHVNASELKTIFKDIKPIFKNATDAALVGFTVEKHSSIPPCVIYDVAGVTP